MLHIGNDWDEILKQETNKEYYHVLRAFLKNEYATQTIYPSMDNVFSCFRLTPYQKVKVVILGQDPYHGANQAHGLCFSVQDGVKCPPSLNNILKEIKSDLNKPIPSNGNLSRWANQGVLLLNTILTVRKGQANSHKNQGWEILTDAVIQSLNERKEPIVFLLWGAHARSKASFITNPNHLVLQSAHPSPLSAYQGFLGCKHFSQANEFLKRHNMPQIDW